jgi:hypothetical protein
LPRLALNRDPPDLCLLSSQDYRHEPLRRAPLRWEFSWKWLKKGALGRASILNLTPEGTLELESHPSCPIWDYGHALFLQRQPSGIGYMLPLEHVCGEGAAQPPRPHQEAASPSQVSKERSTWVLSSWGRGVPPGTMDQHSAPQQLQHLTTSYSINVKGINDITFSSSSLFLFFSHLNDFSGGLDPLIFPALTFLVS